MNILFLTDNFPPEVNAPASRTFEHCRRWVKGLANVTVITCAPNFPQGKVYPGYRNSWRTVEIMDGIRVVRVWTFMAPNTGFFKRIADYLSFAVTAFIAGLKEKPDVIVATSPQFFTTFAGFGLSLCKRRPWVFELRDLWPESVVSVGMVRRGRLYRFFESLELMLYRNADCIVALTPAFKANLVRRGIDPGKIEIVTNGADLSVFVPRADDDGMRTKLGLRDKFIIGYIGTHGLAHGLDFIIEAIPALQQDPIHFVFVGDGSEKAAIKARAGGLKLTNVSFFDPVPRAEVANWISACDAVLVSLRRSETFKTVIPSKIFEAAAMERPILLGVDGQARQIVEEFGAGIYYEPENAEAFRAAVLRLVADSELRKQLIEGGRKLKYAYARDALAERMLTILQRYAARNSVGGV